MLSSALPVMSVALGEQFNALFVCACMYGVCSYECAGICSYVYVYVRVCMYWCVWVCVHVYASMYECAGMYMCVCCSYVCANTYRIAQNFDGGKV